MDSLDKKLIADRRAFEREGELLGPAGPRTEYRGMEITEVQREILEAFNSPARDAEYERLFQEYRTLLRAGEVTLSVGEPTSALLPPKNRSESNAWRIFLLRLAGISKTENWTTLGMRPFGQLASEIGARMITAADTRRRTYLLRAIFQYSGAQEYLKEKRLMAHITEKTGLDWKTLFTAGHEPTHEHTALQSHSPKVAHHSLAQLLELYAAALDAPSANEAARRARMESNNATYILNGKTKTFSDEAIRFIAGRLQLKNFRDKS